MAESAVEPAAESTVPDPFAALERAAAHLASSSVKDRISVFDASLASAVANEGGFCVKHAIMFGISLIRADAHSYYFNFSI